MSKFEDIQIHWQLAIDAGVLAKTQRNSAVPEKIPNEGLVILRDGNPGETERPLGGFGEVYCTRDAEIALYVENGDAATRDAAFDALLQEIGTVLDADPTLGGLAFGMTYGRPEIDVEGVGGAPAIKTGTIVVAIEYETESLLG